jgi:hypothetical protein
LLAHSLRIWLFCITLVFPAACASAQQLPMQNPPAPSQPASPLVVTYQNGLLTIQASNTSLRAVLEAVRKETGAVIETAGDEDQVRVVADLGPGEPATVIAKLLYGTPWNYAVLGSYAAHGKIERIVLMPRRASAPESASMAPSSTFTAPPPPSAAIAAEPEQASSDSEEDAADNPEDETAANEESEEGAGDDDTKSKKASKGADEAGATDSETKSAKGEKQASAEDAEQEQAAESVPAGPPVFPDKLYRMYPSLFGGGGSQATGSGGSQAMSTAAGPNGMPSVISAMGGNNSGSLQGDFTGEAVSPPRNYPPELYNLYPPNLIDLIKNAPTPPPAPSAPLVPPGTGTFWDQGISAGPR